MTESTDYRLYLKSEFERIHEVLGRVEAQTTKTNSRVTHLEERVEELNLADLKHVVDCPAMPKIELLQADLLEYKFFKRYPKVLVILMVIFVIGAIFTTYQTFHIPAKINAMQQNIEEEIRTKEEVSTVRGGYVRYNDKGIRDSVKVR